MVIANIAGRFRFFLPVYAVFILVAATFLLTGCVAGEGDQKKAGRKLMQEYFENTGKKASVGTIYADITRPAADRLEMSDYVKGSFKLGDETYEFWANVETGSIYTSEGMREFGESVLKIQADKLGFSANDCICYASITIEPEFTGETGNSRGQTDTVTLNDVLPVNITDMDEFAEKTLESDHVFVRSFIVCKSSPITDGTKEIDIPGWNRGQITFCVLDNPDTGITADKYDILKYWSENREKCVDIAY